MEQKIPLDSIFRAGSRRSSEGRSARALRTLNEFLRARASLTLCEMETVKEMLEEACPDYLEIVQLENLARSRAASNERTQGWHAGFGDLLKYLIALRNTTKQAA